MAAVLIYAKNDVLLDAAQSISVVDGGSDDVLIIFVQLWYPSLSAPLGYCEMEWCCKYM